MLGAVETVIFAVSVLVVTGTVQDGKSNYLEGAMVSLCSPALLYLQRTNQAAACGTLYYHRFDILGYPHWSFGKSYGLIARLPLLCPVQLFLAIYTLLVDISGSAGDIDELREVPVGGEGQEDLADHL
jgi:hypothetical protein